MESDVTTIFAESTENVIDGENFKRYKNSDKQMELTVQLSEWSQICRVCANTSDHIIPIFEAEGVEHNLCEKMHKYLPIQVSKTDTLPTQLCYHCAATILAWHELLEGCYNAEKQLLEMQSALIAKEQTEKNNDDNLSEELVDDPEPAGSPNKEHSCSIDQRKKEAEPCDPNEKLLTRSDRTMMAFNVFLDKQSTNRSWKRMKNELSKKTPDKKENTIWQEVSCTGEDDFLNFVDSPEHENEDCKCNIDETKMSRNLQRSQQNENFKQLTISDEDNGERCNFNEKTCNICCKKFDHANELEKHMREHKSLANVRKTYKCDECSKIFCYKDSFMRHLRIHRDERPFTCHVCGKQFRDSGGLSRHLKDVHAKLKKFTCDICSNSFSSKATRDDHRRTHTGERPYDCENCEKSFKSRACLYIHSKLHTNVFPYPCAHCNKKFRRRQEMLVHVSTHTGEKKYSCDICSRRFRVKTEITRHKLTHTNEKPYVCATCGLSFRQNRYLNNHVKSRHARFSNDRKI